MKQRLSKYRKSFSFEDALNLDSTGVMLRGSEMQPCPYSKAFPHEIYNKIVLYIPRGKMEIVMIAFQYRIEK